MSLFGSLYIGASGLQTSQNALNTTAHNMSNIDTVGYVRQQVQQGTRNYNTLSTAKTAISYQQTGLGVSYVQVKQVRDEFLDRAYRRETGRGAFYEVSANAFDEVYKIFQELEGESFSLAINNLWASVQDLSRDPGNAVNQGVFIQRCSEFVNRAQGVYTSLSEYQDNLNKQISQQIDTMNAYGRRIAELNQAIQRIEGGGIEKANDLKDERNLLIDELSAMGSIECRTDAFGNVLIRLEGKEFVKTDSANEIKLYTDPVTGFYTPYWSHLARTDKDGNVLTQTKADGTVDPIGLEGARLFNMKQTISTESNTDIGALKSMLFARGDKRATFKDLDPKTYNKEISQSVMMNMQAEFDQLVHQITTEVNRVFYEAALAAKTENPDSNYLCDASGKPYLIFDTNTNTHRGSYDAADYDEGAYTVENILINGELKQSPSLLGFKKDDDKIDQETADNLKKIFTDEKITLNPNVKTKTNFISYYDDLISQAANTGNVMMAICENQQETVDGIYGAREQILGVSADEEMSNMVMFQNAYNASSRYINVISEMMEHLISTLGR